MSQDIDSKYRPLFVLAGVFAIFLIGAGMWAMDQYARGNDPLLWMNVAFVTVEDQEETQIVPQTNDEKIEKAEVGNEGKAEEEALPSGEQVQPESSSNPQPLEDGKTSSKPGKEDTSSTSKTEGSGNKAPAQSSQESTSSSSSNSSNNASGSSSESKPNKEPAPVPADTISVSITIDPGATGISGGSAQLTLQPGATVYDALTSCGVSVNSQETAMGVYVVAINGLAEKDYGPTSGWTYLVNGSMPQHACNYHELHDGDSIVWRYVNVEK